MYDDAMARGNAAVIAKQSKKKDKTLSLILGNLGPGQEATLKL